jgi:hypothetical protein
MTWFQNNSEAWEMKIREMSLKTTTSLISFVDWLIVGMMILEGGLPLRRRGFSITDWLPTMLGMY